jgi:hypothetical protein
VLKRTNITQPLYSPNYADEAGIYLQYIVEHYEDLPELMFFVQVRLAPCKIFVTRPLNPIRATLTWSWMT